MEMARWRLEGSERLPGWRRARTGCWGRGGSRAGKDCLGEGAGGQGEATRLEKAVDGKVELVRWRWQGRDGKVKLAKWRWRCGDGKVEMASGDGKLEMARWSHYFAMDG